MKNLNFVYNKMPEGTDMNEKPYFKQWLLENIPDFQFVHPLARNHSQQICFSPDLGKTVEFKYL